MPNKTAIQWTDYSSNPIKSLNVETGKRGWWCTKVSPGCAYCYAERTNRHWGNGLKYLPKNDEMATRFVDDRELKAIRTFRCEPGSRVFLCDMTDLFHERLHGWMLLPILDAIASRPDVTFQVLTKRAELAYDWLTCVPNITDGPLYPDLRSAPWPLPNLDVGVSAENQHWADERVPYLLQTPAARRFISSEPLLGPIDVRPWLGKRVPCSGYCPCDSYFGIANGERCLGQQDGPFLDQVIAGGESGGPKRRQLTSHREWVTHLRDQCIDAGVPFFFKQWGGAKPSSNGREIDGREWNELPAPRFERSSGDAVHQV